MENKTRMIPIAGKIQHGEKQKNKVVELKRFIAKSQNDAMKFLADRFNEKYPNCNSLKIRIFDDQPLYTRYARYNQGGLACYCNETEEIAKQKTSNKWEQKRCNENCEHRQKDKYGKCACNLEGILKFMLPDICQDRIWIMQIKGRTSIRQLKDYFLFQKQLGNSIIGDYILFLSEKEQPTENGIYKNQILNIVKAENRQNEIINSNVSTINTQNVEKEFNNENKQLISDEKESVTKPSNTDNKSVANKTNQKTKQEKIETIDENALKQNDIKNIYYFVSSKFSQFKKDGKMKDYLVLTVADSEDKQLNVIIPPKYTEDVFECDLGTIIYMELEIKEKYALPKDIKYLNKCIKKAVA